MSGSKIIPIIDSGAIVRARRCLRRAGRCIRSEIDAKIEALNAKVDAKIEELIAKRDAEGDTP